MSIVNARSFAAAAGAIGEEGVGLPPPPTFILEDTVEKKDAPVSVQSAYDKANQVCMKGGDPDACPSFEQWLADQEKKKKDAGGKVEDDISSRASSMAKINEYMRAPFS